MRPILIWFGKRPLIDCTVKENSIFAVGLARVLVGMLQRVGLSFCNIDELDLYGAPTNSCLLEDLWLIALRSPMETLQWVLSLACDAIKSWSLIL
jgi:hypothetical protein